MARKPRDYRAEYARRKARLRAEGFTSPKQYTRVRKENMQYTLNESRQDISRFNKRFTPRETMEYHRAFVKRDHKQTRTMNWLIDHDDQGIYPDAGDTAFWDAYFSE